MRKRIISLGVMALLFAACSVNEMDIATPADKEAEEFFATIEDASTKVFVDDELMVLWHADDRVSIFNKYTYNQQYRFTGNTGANSGSFTKVPNDDFITGNALNYVYAIYPYKESTEISNQGVLTIDLPAIQSYAENSFGIGANTMISCSEGNELLFKNLCGYIMLKLYGDDVSVTSISIKGNNNEPLAGKATVNASIDNAPTMTFDASATNEITLSFDTPVTLGTTAESATTFWLVVPPTTFSKGITLTVKDDKNGEFKKSSTASLQISRNTLKRLSTIQVISEPSDDVIVFADENVKAKLVAAFDANEDGELSYAEAAKVTSLDGVFGTTKTYSSFDEFQYFTSVTMVSRSLFEGWLLTSIKLPDSIRSIQSAAFKDCSLLSSVNIPSSVEKLSQDVFYGCSRLSSIIIPNTITEIGNSAFYNCESLTTLDIPESVSTIGAYAFWGCKSLTSINIPESITSISAGTFRHCSSLTSILLPESVTSIGLGAFANCSNLSSINIPRGVYRLEQEIFSHCSSLTNVVIPDWVTIIGPTAFYDCKNLTTLTLSESVSRIGDDAFMSCTSLTSITVKSKTPPIGGSDMFYRTNNCPIYVPAESVDAYKSAQYWSYYASRIQAIPSSVPIPEAIDLGLPSGIKWASFNLGASKPEEYGGYYAWGEVETYYSSLEPLMWKEGKEAGYDWPSYKWCNGEANKLTKYCPASMASYWDGAGIPDGKTVLDPEDDAAYVNLGGNWRMPTDDEWTELRENCTWSWTTQNGVDGYLVTGPNGNRIFFPAAGLRSNTSLYYAGSDGDYWSSSLYTDSPHFARGVQFNSDNVGTIYSSRYYGHSVRPVTE